MKLKLTQLSYFTGNTPLLRGELLHRFVLVNFSKNDQKSSMTDDSVLLRAQAAFVYMAIYMEISLRNFMEISLSKQWQDPVAHVEMIFFNQCKLNEFNANLINAKQMLRYWLFIKQ